MLQQRESRRLWEDYWCERQSSLQNRQGKQRVVASAFDPLQKIGAGGAYRPARVIELGCGEGHILGELLKLCADANIPVGEFVGLDIQPGVVERARRLYPRANFCVADYTNGPLKLKPFDVVLLVGTLHEVYSANRSASSGEIDREAGRGGVERALGRAAALAADGGYVVLFDGVEHALPHDSKITVRFQSVGALDEFKKFAAEYEAFIVAYESRPGRRVRVSVRDFTRYITKTRFINGVLWEIEKRESYQYFSEQEFRKCLRRLGLKLLTLECLSPHRGDWEARVRIETPGVDFPNEHILIVGQKVSGREIT